MGLEFQCDRCQRATAAVLFTALVCVCYKGAKFLFVVCSAASCEVELPVPGQHLATTQGFMDLELWTYFEPLLKFHTNTPNPPIFHEISL